MKIKVGDTVRIIPEYETLVMRGMYFEIINIRHGFATCKRIGKHNNIKLELQIIHLYKPLKNH